MNAAKERRQVAFINSRCFPTSNTMPAGASHHINDLKLKRDLETDARRRYRLALAIARIHRRHMGWARLLEESV